MRGKARLPNLSKVGPHKVDPLFGSHKDSCASAHTHTHTHSWSVRDWVKLVFSVSTFTEVILQLVKYLKHPAKQNLSLLLNFFYNVKFKKKQKFWFKIEVLVFSTWSKLEPSFISSYEFSLRSVPDGGISQPLRRRKRSTKPSCSTVLSLQHDSIFLSEMTCLYCV